MSAARFRFGAFGLPALLIVVAGCGWDDDMKGFTRQAVSGLVTLDGKPLPTATIVFVPNVPDADADAVASGMVEDGKFSIPRAGGPIPGTYKVKISWVAINQPNPDASPDAPSRITRETLPEKYNTATILTATIGADQPNELEFHLDSK